jgi:hypothetical protein
VGGTEDLVKETGAVRNKNEFKLQVLPRGDAIAISLFHSLPPHHPPLPKLNVDCISHSGQYKDILWSDTPRYISAPPNFAIKLNYLNHTD